MQAAIGVRIVVTAPLQSAQLMCTSTCYAVISMRLFGSFWHSGWG